MCYNNNSWRDILLFHALLNVITFIANASLHSALPAVKYSDVIDFIKLPEGFPLMCK